jgi:hypothetical protein
LLKNASRSRLIVEGHDDKHSVIGLMRWHIEWPKGIDRAPVYIDVGNSADEILERAFISTLVKSSEIDTIGIMVDADANPAGRYESIKSICDGMFYNLPKTMPSTGLIVENDHKQRLGLWIMPDNYSSGCLETFLHYLVPNSADEVWAHARESTEKARVIGATYRDPHIPKASIYTWLAWQDPPGQSPGLALTKKILNPHSGYTDPFVKWFRELYGL